MLQTSWQENIQSWHWRDCLEYIRCGSLQCVNLCLRLNVFNLFWENHQSGFEVCKLFRCDADKLFWFKHFKPHLVPPRLRNHRVVYKCELKINLSCVSIRYVPFELVTIFIIFIKLKVVRNEFEVKVIGCLAILLLEQSGFFRICKVRKERQIPNLNLFVNYKRELTTRGNLLGLYLRWLLINKLFLFNFGVSFYSCKRCNFFVWSNYYTGYESCWFRIVAQISQSKINLKANSIKTLRHV